MNNPSSNPIKFDGIKSRRLSFAWNLNRTLSKLRIHTFPVHPHMLRHATGYKLANDGQDTRAIQHYLGHRNICHTVIYTNLSPDRFKGFWQD